MNTPRPETPAAPTTPPDAFFLAHLQQWLVITVNDHFPRYPEIKPYGTHALAFLYIDHEKGLALRILAFLVINSDDGFPRITRDVVVQDGRSFILLHRDTPDPAIYNTPPFLIARDPHFPSLTIRSLRKAEQAALALPPRPPGMEVYDAPHLDKIRQYSWLAPFRAPWYPDDIGFYLKPNHIIHGLEEIQCREQVWGRIERLHDDGNIECILLNEPNMNSGYHRNDRVLVACYQRECKTALFCVGHA